MDSITVGSRVKLKFGTSSVSAGSTATILYIDDFDIIYIEWSDGKLASFPEHQFRHSFEKI